MSIDFSCYKYYTIVKRWGKKTNNINLVKKGGEKTKEENQLFYYDLFNTNSVRIFYKYYGSARDELIISQLKAGRTQSQIAKELGISQPSLSRCVNKIINHYTKFCKCVGEITADRLKGEQNDWLLKITDWSCKKLSAQR